MRIPPSPPGPGRARFWRRSLLREPLTRHIRAMFPNVSPRRLAGLRWFWREGFFVQGAESFSADFIPLFALAAGATSGDIGMLAAAANLVMVAGYLPGAFMVSRVRSRKGLVIATSYGASRAMLVVLALLPFIVSAGPALVYLIIAVNALRFFGGSLGNAAWTSLVADLVPQESRGRYFASRFIVIGCAALVGSPLAGWVIRTINGSSVHALPGYQTSLLIAFALGMGSTLFWSRIPEPPALSARRVLGSRRNVMAVLRRNPAFAALALSCFVWSAGANLAGPFFNVFIVTDLGGNAAAVGTTAGVFALTGLLGQVVFGRLTDRRGNRAMLIVTGLLIPILPCAWALARVPFHGYLVNFFSGFLWAGYNLASFNILLEMSPPEDRESSFGIYQTVVATGAVLGPLAGGYLVGLMGYRPVFVASGLTRLIATILFIVLVRPRKSLPAA
jgi:MFS family permease